MTFPRKDPHEVLVKQIQEALTALGWCVEPTGQGQFSATMQENLHNCALPDGRPLPFRWLPDLLATRPPHAYFIDAKSSETWRQTGNHALEQNALAAALNWTAIWEMDVWYIFTDGSGTTARQLAKPSAKWPGPQRGNGSGTPFWLFPVGLTTPWEQLPSQTHPQNQSSAPLPTSTPNSLLTSVSDTPRQTKVETSRIRSAYSASRMKIAGARRLHAARYAPWTPAEAAERSARAWVNPENVIDLRLAD